jgi:hypothetical protein
VLKEGPDSLDKKLDEQTVEGEQVEDPIRRAGRWWQCRPDGGWMRWNEQNSEWEEQAGSPPPPARSEVPAAPPPPLGVRAAPPPPSGAPTAGRKAAPGNPSHPRAPREILPANGKGRRDLRPTPEFLKKILAVAVIGALLVGGAWSASALLANDDVSDPAPQGAAANQEPKPASFSKAKKSYLRKMNGTCKRVAAKLFALGAPRSEAQIVPWIRSYRALNQQFLSEMKAIDAPKQDHRLLKRLFNTLDQIDAIFGEFLAAYEGNELATMQTLSAQAEGMLAEASELSAEYGLGRCGGRSELSL